MTGNQVGQFLVFLMLITSGFQAVAQNLFTVRSPLDFEQSMEELKTSIAAHGYTVSHVQRCDGGLHQSGYETDYYRVIFFGKLDEVRQLSENYPELIPFLPLKIAVFAEGRQTIISSLNLSALNDYYDDRLLEIQFKRWENDVKSILADLQKSHLSE